MQRLMMVLIFTLSFFSNNIKHLRIDFEEPLVFNKRKIELNNKEEIFKGTLQEYTMRGPFLEQGVVSEEVIILYSQEYFALPSQLKNSIGSITITSDDLHYVCGIQSPYKVKGCARSDTLAIYLDASYRHGDLLHESIHTYSYQNDRVFSEAFSTIYVVEGNKINVQAGNTHNIYEYFVSAYLYYLMNPNYLIQVCPQTYRYFQNT